MTRQKTSRTKTIVSVGALIGVGALATTAAFTDFGNLNLGAGADGSAIGAGAFDIKVVGTDVNNFPEPGTWQDANTAEGVDIAIPGADTVTPGDTITVDLPYKNASETLGADIKLWMNLVPGTTSDDDYVAALTFTVKDSDGTPIVEDVAFADFNALAEAADLTPTALAAGSDDSLTLEITLSDLGVEGNADLNGGVAHVQAHFDAVSVAS